MNQVSSNASYYGWVFSGISVNDWYAYDPTLGQAGVKYQVWNQAGDNWYLVVNQGATSNKGTFVYLGFTDNETTNLQEMFLSNMCITGWGCYGWPVYWDDMGYTD